jgi:hypothetical protein
MTLSLTVTQPDDVYVQRTHALQEEAEAERAAGDFIGERLGFLVDADRQQRSGQALVGHVFKVELDA